MKKISQYIFTVVACLIALYSTAQWKPAEFTLATKWSTAVGPENALPEYPRPQMVRTAWTNLNGLWSYAVRDSLAAVPKEFDGKILVPYPLESALSGVGKALQPEQRLWYQRSVTLDKKQTDKRYLLHFGAVDFRCEVWFNGQKLGTHTGGYQSFSFDISAALVEGNNTITVAVTDPSDKGNNPHGKQALNPQGIMYTASSGIWQTVWLEPVPEEYIGTIRITPNLDEQYVSVRVNTTSEGSVTLRSGSYHASGNSNEEIRLKLDQVHAWSPKDPYLYPLQVIYGKDTVNSYFGMRKVEIKKDSSGIERIFLNNRYRFNLGVLDQGFWPDGLYTAPTDEALRWDITAIQSMGFNTIRKHIKIEPERWYYHCDRLGMLVWQDMPTNANLSPEAKAEFEAENNQNIEQLYDHPSIVCWVLFNEGWNRYDQQRITDWAKTKDSSRIIDGHTGENYDRSSPRNLAEKWIHSDLTDVHAYPGPDIAPAIKGKARVLGEWGGVRVVTPGHQWNAFKGWGYIESSAQDFARKYSFMMRHLQLFEEEGLSASIYTQPFDVEIEENGLVTYDRALFKIPPEKIRQINQLILKNKSSH